MLNVNQPMQTHDEFPVELLEEKFIEVNGSVWHLCRIEKECFLVNAKDGRRWGTSDRYIQNKYCFEVGKIYHANNGDKYVILNIFTNSIQAVKIDLIRVSVFELNGNHSYLRDFWLEPGAYPNEQ